MKAMISQPMGGKTEKEILNTRNIAKWTLEAKGYEVIDSLLSDEFYKSETKSLRNVNRDLFLLGASLEKMAQCDTVYFCKGWWNNRGCRIEHNAAVAYNLNIIYE